MAEEFFMFDSVNEDRLVTAADFAKYYTELLTNGVFYRNNAPSLTPTKGDGLSTKVSLGAAFIEGYLYRNTSEINLAHEAGDATSPRIDRIVVRLDRNVAKRDIRVVVKKGVPATNPVPPSLERNDIIYELSLARVSIDRNATSVGIVTDERRDKVLCGIVNGVLEVPTDVYQKQWDDFINNIELRAPALGGMTISVQSTEPEQPKNRDIWIDTSN